MNKNNDADILKPEEIGETTRPKAITKKAKKVEQVNMKKPIIWTVVITLAVVAAFIGTFIAGMNYANDLHNQREQAVKAATTDLKAPTPQAQ